MKRRIFIIGRIIVTAALLISLSSPGFAQGSLTPPGTPAPTFKTLTQVEPRTPISQSDLPMIVTQSGSYYLTGNITFSTNNTHGILIRADFVTIDLNGFVLRGPGKTAGSSGDAIRVDTEADHTGITVRNGSIANWRGAGFRGSDTFGSSCLLVEVRSYNNGGNGISVGFGSVVRHCLARTNAVHGIQADTGSSIIECNSALNADDGINIDRACFVIGNTSDSNGTDGTGAGIHAVIQTSDIAGRNRIEGNSVTNNDRGIEIDSPANLVIRNSAAGNNVGFDFTGASGAQTFGATIPAGTITSTNPWSNVAY